VATFYEAGHKKSDQVYRSDILNQCLYF